MAYLNKVMLIGNIGKDPEIRMSQNTGRKCASFSLATSKRYRDNNGEQKEQTTWHNVVAWGKIADTIEMLGLAKGTSLYVEGEITTRSWTDQNDQKRYVTEINMSTFQILTPRNTPQHQPSQDAHGNMQGGIVPGPAYGTDDDDGLPF